jgi:hypothetical protein
MNAYETTTRVQSDGQVHLTGLPFAPGTEVEVTLKPTLATEQGAAVSAAERAAMVFAALDKARNTESVGPLRREELYDRQVLR